MSCHVFLDNSNLYHGLHHHIMCSPLCIDVDYLKQLWVGNFQLDKSWVAGSAMDTARHDAIYWSRWERQGFSLMMTTRKSKEVFVDDALHAQILFTLMTHHSTPAPKLVLVSGDGNENHGRTSFPACVCLALKLGWSVDVWAWKEGTHSTWFHLQRFFPQLNVHFLNDHLKRFINMDLLIDVLHPSSETEDDRMQRVMLHAEAYANSITSRCPRCQICNKHRRLPVETLCVCRWNSKQF